MRHVVEGDPQFRLALRELIRAFAQFVEQPGVLDRYHRLVGKGSDQRNLSVGEGLPYGAIGRYSASDLAPLEQRNNQKRACAHPLQRPYPERVAGTVGIIRRYIRHMHRRFRSGCLKQRRQGTRLKRVIENERRCFGIGIARRNRRKGPGVVEP